MRLGFMTIIRIRGPPYKKNATAWKAQGSSCSAPLLVVTVA